MRDYVRANEWMANKRAERVCVRRNEKWSSSTMTGMTIRYRVLIRTFVSRRRFSGEHRTGANQSREWTTDYGNRYQRCQVEKLFPLLGRPYVQLSTWLPWQTRARTWRRGYLLGFSECPLIAAYVHSAHIKHSSWSRLVGRQNKENSVALVCVVSQRKSRDPPLTFWAVTQKNLSSKR